MTDKEKVVELLSHAGFTVRSERYDRGRMLLENGVSSDTLVVENESGGSVAFSFDESGNLKDVWGRNW